MVNKKLKSIVSRVATVSVLTIAMLSIGNSPVLAANRDFHNIRTGEVYYSSEWRVNADKYQQLITALTNDPDNMAYEFGGKGYSYTLLSQKLSSSTNVEQAFIAALSDSSLMVDISNDDFNVVIE